MKKTVSILMVFVVGLQFLSSCNKYEDGPFISLRSKTARLTSEWSLTKIEDEQTNDYVEYEGKYSYEFQKNNAFIGFVDNKEKRASQIGKWDWKNDKEEVEISSAGFPFSGLYEIKRLKSNSMVLKGEFLFDGEPVENVTFRFERVK